MLQVEELRDKLWGMCDAKMEENTKLRSELVDPEIKANTIGDFAQCLSALVQVLSPVLVINDHSGSGKPHQPCQDFV